MASVLTPRRRPTPSSRATPASHAEAPELPGSEKKRLNGTWQDGQWWCNCDPRKAAALRAVKKESPNKGRLFWGCRAYPSCDLFIWREDADVRVKGLSAGSKQTEHDESEHSQAPKTSKPTQKPLEWFGIQTSPARRPAVLSAGGSDDGDSESADTSFVNPDIMRQHAPASAASPASPTTPSSKRKRIVQEDGEWDDGDSLSDLNSDDERKLVEMADDSAKKAAQKDAANEVFATPTASRGATDIMAGLPTPSVSRTLFPAPDGKRSKAVTFEDPASPSTRPPSSIPRSGPTAPLGTSSSDSIQDLIQQAMALLRSQNLDPTVLGAVERLLDTASRKTKAIALSREKTWEALQEKNEKNLKLKDRIRNLKSKATADNQALTEVKRKIMDLYHGI